MKTAGMVRRIDNLGRVVIPMEIRKSLGIKPLDPIDISVDKGGKVLLTPCSIQCVCCGGKGEELLKEVDGVHLCPTCIKRFGGRVQ